MNCRLCGQEIYEKDAFTTQFKGVTFHLDCVESAVFEAADSKEFFEDALRVDIAPVRKLSKV